MKIDLTDRYDIGGAWKILTIGKLLHVFILIRATLFLLSKQNGDRAPEFLFYSSTAKKNYWTVGPENFLNLSDLSKKYRT
jgi:hypothetical protein